MIITFNEAVFRLKLPILGNTFFGFAQHLSFSNKIQRFGQIYVVLFTNLENFMKICPTIGYGFVPNLLFNRIYCIIP